MEFSTNQAIIILSSLIVLSYIFDLIAKWSKIPSVMLLLATGVGLNFVLGSMGVELSGIQPLVQLVGTIGLIMIVFEASLDLKLSKSRLKLVGRSFLSAFLILCVSSLLVAWIILQCTDQSFRSSLAYAIPLSIISSAIVIPSVAHLGDEIREFTTYEASFSDILGILLFNFAVADQVLGSGALISFIGVSTLSVILSILISFAFIFLIARITTHIKFFLILALLILMYGIGKTYHMPSLVLILIFGITINNLSLIPGTRSDMIDLAQLPPILSQLKSITAESAFLIRTFFFVLFGYSISLSILADIHVVAIGSLVVAALLFIRYLYLKAFVRKSVMPELFLMPRGLITIILFYNIPAWLKSDSFNEGVILFVIIMTSVLMMVGLALYKKDDASSQLSGSSLTSLDS